MQSNSKTLGSIAEEARAGVSEEFQNLLVDVEDLIRDTTTLTADELGKAKAKLGARVTAAKASLEEMGGAVAKRARKSAAATNEYVHEQPWKAIGAGAAVAFLLGFVLARRS
ncbi:MAG: DUF883 family protein [Pseudomonadota bacterium]|nr:DUF883 family protein [Pseudomonadota bacterium]